MVPSPILRNVRGALSGKTHTRVRLPHASSLLLLSLAAFAWFHHSRECRGDECRSRPVQLTGQQHAATVPPATAAAARAPCRLSTDGSVWDNLCYRLQRVCVDEQQIILYEKEYQHQPAFRLPKRTVYFSGQQPNKASEENEARVRKIQFFVARPVGDAEPAAYLRSPNFSTCTVPVVVPPGMSNLGHLMVDLAGPLEGALQQTPWREHVKIVVGADLGLHNHEMHRAVLPALSNLSVQSMADFSRRLPEQWQPGTVPGASSPHPPASWEGGEQRCFERMYVCGNGFPDRWRPGNKMDNNSVSTEMYVAGQRVVQHVMAQPTVQQAAGQVQQGGQAAAALVPGQGLEAGNSSRTGSNASGGSKRPTRQLRIVFMDRLLDRKRRILHVTELVRTCNGWQHRAADGTITTFVCTQMSFPDVPSGVVTAQEADVFVGMLGAQTANALFMRPGSSMIEIMPHESWKYVRHLYFLSDINSRDNSSQLLWWLAAVCDPRDSKPGFRERTSDEFEPYHTRDRHAVVRWRALLPILREIIAVGGSREQYTELWKAGRHRFNLGPEAMVEQGPECPPLQLPPSGPPGGLLPPK